MSQRGSAATEEDPPNDAKNRERFKARGQESGITPFLASFGVFGGSFLFPIGSATWRREKIFANRDEFRLSHCGWRGLNLQIPTSNLQ
jgi:hypothetical protein